MASMARIASSQRRIIASAAGGDCNCSTGFGCGSFAALGGVGAGIRSRAAG